MVTQRSHWIQVVGRLPIVLLLLASCDGPIEADGGGHDQDAGPLVDAEVTDAARPLEESGSDGCSAEMGLADGEHRFELDGLERRYSVRLPRPYDPARPWPVVLALHANGNDITYWDRTSGFLNIRDVLVDDAVLVVLEAIDGHWRDYEAPAETWDERIEIELRYVDEVLARVRTGVCVDPGSVFAMGFSGGGSFAALMGCRRAAIRAVAIGGAVRYFDPEACVGTPATWITIGTLELTPDRLALRDLMRERAGCSETSTSVEPAPCVAYDDCDLGTPVHYCQHVSAHVWPDIGNQGMWSFFRGLQPR